MTYALLYHPVVATVWLIHCFTIQWLLLYDLCTALPSSGCYCMTDALVQHLIYSIFQLLTDWIVNGDGWFHMIFNILFSFCHFAALLSCNLSFVICDFSSPSQSLASLLPPFSLFLLFWFLSPCLLLCLYLSLYLSVPLCISSFLPFCSLSLHVSFSLSLHASFFFSLTLPSSVRFSIYFPSLEELVFTPQAVSSTQLPALGDDVAPQVHKFTDHMWHSFVSIITD